MEKNAMSPMDNIISKGSRHIRSSELQKKQKQDTESRKVDYSEAIKPWEELKSRNDELVDRVTGIVEDDPVIWKWSDRSDMIQTNAESKIVPINTGLGEKTLPEGYKLVCMVSHVYDSRIDIADKYENKYENSTNIECRLAPFRERVIYDDRPDWPRARMMNLSFAAVLLSSLDRLMSPEPNRDPFEYNKIIASHSSYGTIGFNNNYWYGNPPTESDIILIGNKHINALNHELIKSAKPGLFDRRRINKIATESEQDRSIIFRRIDFLSSLLAVVSDNISAQ